MGVTRRRSSLVDVVSRDVRDRASREEAEFIRSPAMIGDWLRVLKSTKRDIEHQHKRKKTEVARAYRQWREGEIDRSEYLGIELGSLEWREGAGRVLKAVENRIEEAKELQRYYEAGAKAGAA